MSLDATRTHEPPDQRRKSNLICPSCDHASPPGGDWALSTDGDSMVRHCPECGALVERRQRFTQSSSDRHQPSVPRWPVQWSRLAVACQKFYTEQTRRLIGR